MTNPPSVPLPANEDERLAALQRYAILDSPPEPGFDRITALAARLFGVPVCIVSLVDEGRVWFKSRVGWSGKQVDRQESLCSFAMLQKDLLVVCDAREEERFACNPWVASEPGIRFYAGAPIITPDGFNLGTLCLIDTRPHERFDQEDRQTLTDLAAMVMDELELHLSLQRTARTAAALGESEQRFRNMADNAPVMIWVVDLGGVCTYLSRSWYDFTGQNEQTGLGFGWLDAVHPDDREKARTVFRGALACREAFHMEIRLWCMDGIYRWVMGSAVPRLGLDGGFDGYIGSAMDITSRKQQECWIGEQNRLLERIAAGTTPLHELLDGIVHFIEEQTDHAVLCSVLLLDAHGKCLNHGSAPSLPEAYYRAIDGIAIGPEVGSCSAAAHRNETVVVTDIANDPQWEGLKGLALAHKLLACWSTPIRDTRGKVLGTLAMYYRTARGPSTHEQKMVAAGADMAAIAIERWYAAEARKRLEAERERLLELEQQARVVAEAASLAKDQFLAMLSHELRTPLNPIIGWTQLLQRGKLSPEAQKNALEVIERNAKLQNQLIEDLLDISRIEQGKFSLRPQLLSSEGVVRAALETVRSLAQSAGVTLQIQAGTDLPLISADPTRMTQVIWNLLTNAIKFTPSGGQVGVRLEATPETVRIEVSDSGIGITPEFLPRLFERFRQASEGSTRTQGGLGLGLFIVRHIVQAHGGWVRAESQGESKGATFTVELPAAPTPPAHATPRP